MLVDSYVDNLVTWSTEQSKTTVELQKQYEKLLINELQACLWEM